MNFKPTTGSYLDDRYPFILQVEESGNPHLTPYNDGIGWVSVGVGFNLSDDNVRNQVLAKMNITNPQLINDLTVYLKKQYDGAHPLLGGIHLWKRKDGIKALIDP